MPISVDELDFEWPCCERTRRLECALLGLLELLLVLLLPPGALSDSSCRVLALPVRSTGRGCGAKDGGGVILGASDQTFAFFSLRALFWLCSYPLGGNPGDGGLQQAASLSSHEGHED